MTRNLNETIDYVLGGGLFLLAPFIPNLCEGNHIMPSFSLTDYKDLFTVIIQALSIILLTMRIGRVADGKKDPEDE
jgi:hypothetical protein